MPPWGFSSGPARVPGTDRGPRGWVITPISREPGSCMGPDRGPRALAPDAPQETPHGFGGGTSCRSSPRGCHWCKAAGPTIRKARLHPATGVWGLRFALAVLTPTGMYTELRPFQQPAQCLGISRGTPLSFHPSLLPSVPGTKKKSAMEWWGRVA